MDGTIEIESVQLHGTSFKLVLPVKMKRQDDGK
jgi:chemotaxis protein histidine kinase CheA